MAFVAVHVGCGFHSEESEAELRKVCSAACNAGLTVATAGGDALAIAVAAVHVLEASELTNAGRGSVLNVRGEVECDAAAALAPGPHGPPLFGAVGAVQRLEHPAAVAASVARRGGEEESGGLVLPLLLVGSGAEEDAETLGHALCDPSRLVTSDSRERFIRHARLAAEMRTDDGDSGSGAARQAEKRRRIEPQEDGDTTFAPGTDTVGAVATDRAGRCASVVSSGGISLKKKGRVGQAASQAGAYASAADGTAVGVVSTGVGEELMRTQLAAKCGELVVGGHHLHTVAERLAGDLFLRSPLLGTSARRECGIVAVTSRREAGVRKIEFMLAHSTRSMGVGYASEHDSKPKRDCIDCVGELTVILNQSQTDMLRSRAMSGSEMNIQIGKVETPS